MYSIDYDDRVRVLTIRLTSFWTAATHARFIVEVSARVIAILLRQGKFCIFVDCSEYPIQAPELVEEFEPIIRRAMARGLPVVVLLRSTLALLQARRSLGETDIGIFVDRAEAQRCLAECGRALLPAAQLAG